MNPITFKETSEASHYGSGVIDCNGKEIHAGNSVQVRIFSPWNGQKEITSAQHKVIYSHGAFRLDDPKHGFNGTALASLDGDNVQVEIIDA